jgi:hypothetical protein
LIFFAPPGAGVNEENQSQMIRIQNNSTAIFHRLPLLTFFACVFIYFGFFGDYVLFYQEKFSLFIFSFDFLKENLHQPGGLLIWIGKLFSAFFLHPIAGALIIAGIISLAVHFISEITRLLTGKSRIVLAITAGMILFYMQTDYQFFIFNTLGLLFQLIIFYISIRYLNFHKSWIPLIFAPLLYFVTGGFASIFIILFSIWLVLGKDSKRWIKTGLFLGIAMLTIYISKEYLFYQSISILITYPFTELNTGAQHSIFIYLCGVLALLPLITKIPVRIPEKLLLSKPLSFIIAGIVVIIVMSGIGFSRFDKKSDHYFHVEKLFYQKKFDEIIAFNSKNPPTNQLTIFLNNIALSETSRLNDQLFRFPQSTDGGTLFLKWEMIGEILRRGGYFYYTIGMINEAHRWAFENMVMKGHTPEGLKMLIKTELINGNYKVAKKYIDLLKKTLFYKKEALNYEKLLFNDIAVNADKELGEKRRTRLQIDFFAITDDPYINIGRVLATDSLNKKAFEYMTAIFMIKKDYQSIAGLLPKFADLGYTHFPVHVEEAATALSVLNNGVMPDLGMIPLSINTTNRWNQYLTVFQQYGTNPKAAEPALRKQFGNTFWYWAFYR